MNFNFFKFLNILTKNKKSQVAGNSKNYFKPAGNLDNQDFSSIEEIENFLMTIVSGTEYEYECELGTLCSAGSMIISFDTLKKMAANENYNIVKAEYLSSDMFAVTYQEYRKINNKNDTGIKL